MSIFEKRPRELKFLYIITYFGIRLPNLAILPLCFVLLFYFIRDLEHYAVNIKIADISQIWGRNLANLFFIKQGWSFSGDVLNILRHENSIYVPKVGVLVWTLFYHFYTHFFGDLLYFRFRVYKV